MVAYLEIADVEGSVLVPDLDVSSRDTVRGEDTCLAWLSCSFDTLDETRLDTPKVRRHGRADHKPDTLLFVLKLCRHHKERRCLTHVGRHRSFTPK